MLLSTVYWQRVHSVHSDLDTDNVTVLLLTLQCNKCNACRQTDGPLTKEEVSLLNVYISRREQKVLRPGMTAGEGQQQFNWPTKSVTTVGSKLWSWIHGTQNLEWLCLRVPAVIYLTDLRTVRVTWLPESWDSKIWSQVLRDSEPRMSVLVRTSSNLPNPTLSDS
jgi:hypothetical protein